jgi:polysaccharide pyruvyl transferase WcaK-like protein
MKPLSLIDTSISSSNLGDQIIMDAIYEHLNDIFPDRFLYKIPYMEITQHTLNIIKECKMCFFGGSNSLVAAMENYSQWGIDKYNYRRINNLVLFGVGWWQYQEKISKFTQKVLRTLLINEYIHAVRDSYTEIKLKSIGINNVINTGCPTIWNLSNYQISNNSSESVIFTITDYNQNPARDRKWLSLLTKRYDVIYFWIQGAGDFQYLQNFKFMENVRIISPRLINYTDLLTNINIDYVGTRLHAGIRALQKKKKTFIIGIDNRAIEMQKDFNIPVFSESEIDKLEVLLYNDSYQTQFKIPQEKIQIWKKQFNRLITPPPLDIVLLFVYHLLSFLSCLLTCEGDKRYE